jgi:hypothetical protein
MKSKPSLLVSLREEREGGIVWRKDIGFSVCVSSRYTLSSLSILKLRIPQSPLQRSQRRDMKFCDWQLFISGARQQQQSERRDGMEDG